MSDRTLSVLVAAGPAAAVGSHGDGRDLRWR